MAQTGNGGSFKIATVALAISKWSLSAEKAEVDASSLIGTHYECLPGRVKAKANITVHFDSTTKSNLTPYFTGATPTVAAAACELWLDSSGTGKFTGNAHVLSVNHTHEIDSLVTMELTIAFTGQITTV